MIDTNLKSLMDDFISRVRKVNLNTWAILNFTRLLSCFYNSIQWQHNGKKRKMKQEHSLDTTSANRRFYSQLCDWDAVCPWVGILLFLFILSIWTGASPGWILEVLIRVGSKMRSWSLLWPLGVAIIQIINQKTCFSVHRGCCQFFPEPCLILYS